MPSVTLIILNWNARHLLARCLPSLLAQTYDDYRVVLVDNASTDDSLAFVRREFPQVEIVENERNRGFSAGNNAALRRLQSDVAVLVNPDLVASAGWLRELVAGLTSEESIGIAGGKLFYPGRRRLQHAGGLIHFPLAMPDYLGRNEPDEEQHDRWAEAALSWSRVVEGRPQDANAARRAAHALLKAGGDLKRAKERLTCVSAVHVVTTLSGALDQIRQITLQARATRMPAEQAAQAAV